MLIKCITVGPFETNCYIVTDEKTLQCAVIDPGADSGQLLFYLDENSLKCTAILLTHGHYDHTGAVKPMMDETGAPLWMHKADDGITISGEYYRFRAPEGTKFVSEGDVITVGSLRFTVLETPGHTPGGLTFLCEEDGDEEKVLFTGDTLFRGSCGRTDFPYSNTDDMLASLRRLAALPGNYEVYPGHMEATTMVRERAGNYFIAAARRQ